MLGQSGGPRSACGNRVALRCGSAATQRNAEPCISVPILPGLWLPVPDRPEHGFRCNNTPVIRAPAKSYFLFSFFFFLFFRPGPWLPAGAMGYRLPAAGAGPASGFRLRFPPFFRKYFRKKFKIALRTPRIKIRTHFFFHKKIDPQEYIVSDYVESKNRPIRSFSPIKSTWHTHEHGSE